MKLTLPGDARPERKSAPVQSPAASMSGGSYVVRAGDTLSAIADRTLGDSAVGPRSPASTRASIPSD
jgi:nucleoid-associated protein YgaU